MKNSKLPDIVLERYLLNELPEEKAREVEITIRENPELTARLHELKKSNREILEEYSPEVQSRIILDAYEREKRNVPPKPSFSLTAFLKLAVPAGALALFIVSFLFTEAEKKEDIWNRDIVNNNGEITRVKGSENILSIYRKTGERIKALKDGDTARNNDLLQIAYRVTTGRYAVILSIDGRSSVTLHLPQQTGGTDKVDQGKTVYLKNSYELDDAPDFERFFLLVSKEKINIDRIVGLAEVLAKNRERAKTGKLDAGKNIREISFILYKKD